jgi:hypothetical protein
MKLKTLMINNQQDVPIDEKRILTSRFDFVIYKFSVQRLRFPVFDHGNHQCRVHIFGRLQGKAVDNHFIYLEISPEQDFTTFLKELKVNNGFHERHLQDFLLKMNKTFF